jgi:hypothetical protein
MDQKIILSSRNKVIIIGALITIFNPIFAGVIFALFMRSEPMLKKESTLLLILSLLWGGLLFVLNDRLATMLGF